MRLWCIHTSVRSGVRGATLRPWGGSEDASVQHAILVSPDALQHVLDDRVVAHSSFHSFGVSDSESENLVNQFLPASLP